MIWADWLSIAAVIVALALSWFAGWCFNREEKKEDFHPCNDCGNQTWIDNDICAACFTELIQRERWEEEHPEVRCPPRE